jgi:hypothetical protein
MPECGHRENQSFWLLVGVGRSVRGERGSIGMPLIGCCGRGIAVQVWCFRRSLRWGWCALAHIDDRHASEVYQDEQIGVRESPMGEWGVAVGVGWVTKGDASPVA